MVSKVVSHLHVDLSALGLQLKVLLNPAGHPVPAARVHPHAMINPNHPFQRCWPDAAVVSRQLLVAAGGRHSRVSPGLWEHPPAAIPPPMGMYAPVQDHRDHCCWPMDWGRGKGRRVGSSLVGSRGQWGHSGLVRVKRYSDNGDSFTRSLISRTPNCPAFADCQQQRFLKRHVVGTAGKYAKRPRRLGNSTEAIDRCTGTRYNLSMIRSFHHRGLRRLFERGDPSRVGPNQLDRITLALADLEAASKPSDVDLPGYRLHPLRGDLEGLWSISISGNWRITFRFEDGNVYDVDLVDYH